MDEFDLWLGTVLVEDEIDPSGVWPDGMIEVAKQIFEGRGAISPAEFWPAVVQQQVSLAERAVLLFGDDLTRTTDRTRPSFDCRLEDQTAGIRIAYFGQYATNPLMEVLPAQITCEVADFLQAEVVEDLWSGWRPCAQSTPARCSRGSSARLRSGSVAPALTQSLPSANSLPERPTRSSSKPRSRR